MTDQNPEIKQTVERLPISPSLAPALQAANVPTPVALVDVRVFYISLLSMALALVAAVIAKILTSLIALITNISFFAHVSLTYTSPAENHLGWWVVGVPVVGGLIVGWMARYGSTGIRGHGIPEAMERILEHQSRIPARLTFLKPLSAAIAIGTGGPFGAEGPIIATGGALGSLVGQLLSVSTVERKTLLAAGAAAGMAATFGSPVSAVLLAIELLLFEFRPRSFIPVTLGASVASGARFVLAMPYPFFHLPQLHQPSEFALVVYLAVGALVGVLSVFVTRAVYWIEDMFEHSHVHWMWWPALGAVAVGVIGHFQPRTLGVGYDNISDVLSDRLTMSLVASLCVWKFVSWSIALGSGTSGGTLAPLFTIGGAMGLLFGAGAAYLFPHSDIQLPIAALVGMAAIFAGASRAMLASAVFAFETTLQPLALLPLLAGCAAAYLVSSLLMRNTIMTEKIVRRGVAVPSEYVADPLSQIRVDDVATHNVTLLKGDDTVAVVRERFASHQKGWTHQGYPVVDERGLLLGVLTRRDFADPALSPDHRAADLLRRPPIIVYSDLTLRDAADHMINHDVGRLPVVDRGDPAKAISIITRSDLLVAQRRRVDEMKREHPVPFRKPVMPS